MGWRVQSESKTAIVRLRIPNASFGEGHRQLPAESHHPTHCFPVQGTGLTSAPAEGGFGMSFLMVEGAVDPWKQRLPPPHGGGTEFRVVRVLFAPQCG